MAQRFEVYGKEGTERVTRFDLQTKADGSIRLVAVDEHGLVVADGIILAIKPGQKMMLFNSVSPDLGLPLESAGHVAIGWD